MKAQQVDGPPRHDHADLLFEAHDLYHRFGDLPFADRRGTVEAIVERITIGGEEIELTLAALPPFPKMTAFGQRIPRDSCMRAYHKGTVRAPTLKPC